MRKGREVYLSLTLNEVKLTGLLVSEWIRYCFTVFNNWIQGSTLMLKLACLVGQIHFTCPTTIFPVPPNKGVSFENGKWVLLADFCLSYGTGKRNILPVLRAISNFLPVRLMLSPVEILQAWVQGNESLKAVHALPVCTLDSEDKWYVHQCSRS